jgi:tape measure domain-containing protein
VATLSNLIVRIGASTDDFDKKVNASLNKIKRFSSDVAQAGQSLAIGFSAPLIAAGAASLSAAADIEKLEKGLSATMKSTAAASKEFEKLKDLAKLPGLGLEEAVKGSIRLQSLGTSAADARRIMGELGNALSVVGGTRADFGEVIRQLSQLGATGKVTKENLDPIIERIPQLSAIIKEKFGAAALGDPAKTFEKLGISSQQFITIMVDELAKGERAGDTFSNSLENLKDAASQTAAEIGRSLLTVGQQLIDKFFTPGLEKAKALAKEFNGLSDSTKMLTIELLAVAAAIPIAIVVLGTMAEKTIALAQVVMKLWSALGALSSLITTATGGLVGLAAGFVGISAAVGGSLYLLLGTKTATENLDRAAKDNKATFDSLSKTYRDNLVAQGQLDASTTSAYDGLLNYTRGLAQNKTATDAISPSAVEAATAVETYRKIVVSTYEEDFKTAVLKERLSLLQSDYTKQLNDGVIALAKYGSEAGAAAAALAELRITETAPQLKGVAFPSVKNMPRPIDVNGAQSEELKRAIESAKLNEAQNRAAGKRGTEIVRENIKDSLSEYQKAQAKIRQAVSTITTDFSRGIADIILNGGKIGDLFAKLGKQIANTLIRTVIEGGINQVTKSLGNLLGSLGSVGGVVAKLFGSGAAPAGVAASAIPGVLGGAANAAIPAISAAAPAAGGSIGGAIAAANPVTAIVTAVAGVVTALSSVVANFQFAAMNKSLDLIEKETRYSQIHLLHLLEKNNEYLPKLKDIFDSLIRMELRGGGFGSGNNVQITINTTGDTRQMLDALTRELKLLGVVPA